MKEASVVTPARWYAQQADLAIARDAALEGAHAISNLAGALRGVLAVIGTHCVPGAASMIEDAEAAMRRLARVASGSEEPAALRREGGL